MPTARLALLALLLVSVGSASARADECDNLAREIASATGAKKVGRRTGPSIPVVTGNGIKLDVTCRADPIVQAASGDPSPSAAYFRDLSVASQIIIGESADTVQAILSTAYQTALSRRTKSFIQQRGWSASCYADPGGGSLRTLCSVGRIPG